MSHRFADDLAASGNDAGPRHARRHIDLAIDEDDKSDDGKAASDSKSEIPAFTSSILDHAGERRRRRARARDPEKSTPIRSGATTSAAPCGGAARWRGGARRASRVGEFVQMKPQTSAAAGAPAVVQAHSKDVEIESKHVKNSTHLSVWVGDDGRRSRGANYVSQGSFSDQLRGRPEAQLDVRAQRRSPGGDRYEDTKKTDGLGQHSTRTPWKWCDWSKR